MHSETVVLSIDFINLNENTPILSHGSPISLIKMALNFQSADIICLTHSAFLKFLNMGEHSAFEIEHAVHRWDIPSLDLNPQVSTIPVSLTREKTPDAKYSYSTLVAIDS